jgi:hypothetical protein
VFLLIYRVFGEPRKKNFKISKKEKSKSCGGAGKIKNGKKEFDLVELF